ncbi:MAG TPA: glycosyltransferase family 1 protein [Acidimicrobiales bacterium]
MTVAAAPEVVVDADVLGRRRTGDESHVQNLLRELAGLDHGMRLVAVARREDVVPAGVEPFVLSARSRVERLGWSLPRALNALRPRLTHFQYVIPPLYRGRAVVMVHDLSFERMPQLMGYQDRLALRTLVPVSVRRADRVLTVSEWSRADIVDCYGLEPERVVVTGGGLDPAFTRTGDRPDRPPYLLFVGALQPRKGPIVALDALARLSEDLQLVMVGPVKRGFGEVRAAMDRLRLGSRVELAGYVSKKDLAALYRGAACMIFPSHYEGFGLPVLEAMASGTPVVATTAGAIPEVAGDAAVLVPPGDADALAAGVQVAIADRDRLVAAGLDRARRFRWASVAERTLDVYRELLS